VTSDRFARIETLYHAVSARAPEERAAYLEEACGDDLTLRHDVEAFLSQHGVGVPSSVVVARPALASGTIIGTYRIVEQIGAGGMGEVYRAHDSRLDRDVALKVLPQALASDRDRLARLEREARVLASLNHTNIAHVYGLEESNGTRAIAMELIDGETLADRIARGPIPRDEALPIARQIAAALAAAHDRGVIHRDLKPANVKLRPDGTVKVLDFGLARSSDSAPSIFPATSLTVSVSRTQPGLILGTAAYMSPEQATGQAVDRRTDLWAFGVVLLEMLSGRRVFKGETLSDVVAAVLKDEPDWSALPRNTPPSVLRLLRRCLAKVPSERLDSASAARFELEDEAPGPHQPHPRARLGVAVIATTLLLAAAAGAAWLMMRPAAKAPVRLTVELGAPASMANEIVPNIALSPDGTTLAFVALTRDSRTTQLYVRRLAQLNAVAVPDTDGARNPFFSPDSRWVAFFDQAHFALKKVAVDGGAPVTVTDARDWRGGDWTDDDTIVFQATAQTHKGFARVSAAGGTPQPFLDPRDVDASIRWPQILPDKKGVLFTAGTAGKFEAGTVMAQPLGGSKPHVVVPGGYYGRYLSTGHLVYVHQNVLFAAPFDLNRLEITGAAVPVIENINGSDGTGSAEFAVSRTGALVYVPNTTEHVISLMDQSGATSPFLTLPNIWTNPALSPRGDRLALDMTDGTKWSLWVYDLARNTETRLAPEETDVTGPVWMPDGRRVVFSLIRNGHWNIFWAGTDGGIEPQRLIESDHDQVAFSWDPSGKLLAYAQRSSNSAALMILRMSGDGTSDWNAGSSQVFLTSSRNLDSPMFSPDGHSIAYESEETGRREVFVRPYPEREPQVLVSSSGGWNPEWSPSTHELLYRGSDNRIMVAAYEATGTAFRPGKPKPWAERALPDAIMRPLQKYPFAIQPDGQRVALFVPPPSGSGLRDKIILVTNFFDELTSLHKSGTR
jgi:serine/threonine-protein kinase